MFKSKTENKGFFEAFSSKTSFIMGLIVGVLIICTVGFFVLLTGNFKVGKDDDTVLGNNNVNSQPAQPSNQVNNQGANNLKKITKDNHVRGDLNAPVMLVEFSDFQCPYCSRVHPTLAQLVDDYNGKVAWAYKHFPLDQLHPYARKAAEASECASEQGKFWEYSDGLYANQQLINQDYFSTLAEELGLNTAKFNDCLTSEKYKDLVKANEQEAVAVGVTGTPGIYVNDQLVKGALPYDSFKQIIDSILAK